MPTVSLMLSFLSRSSPTPKAPIRSTTNSDSGNMIFLSSPSVTLRTSRNNAENPPEQYGFHVDYSNISSGYETFIASLDSVIIPKCWQVAKGDPKWKAAMQEEPRVLDNNSTWELVPLSLKNKTDGCKWVFTIKQNPDGHVERYKACLVAKSYSQTYGIDYNETFALVAKISIVRTMVSLTVNDE